MGNEREKKKKKPGKRGETIEKWREREEDEEFLRGGVGGSAEKQRKFNRTEINKLLQDNHVKDQLKEILSDKALMEARIELAVRGEYPFVFTEDVYAAFDDVVDDGGDMLRELSKWGKEQLLQEV